MSEVINNGGKRIEKLKSIIKRLHKGAPTEEVRAELEEIVRSTDAGEIAQMEQELIAGGMKPEEIQSMCDLHAQVLRGILAEPKKVALQPGHPIDTFRRENEALSSLVKAMRKTVAEIKAVQKDSEFEKLFLGLRQSLNELMDIDKHYQRKEYLLFSRLEERGVSGPSQVMWGKDDEVREMLKALDGALSKKDLGLAGLKKAAESLAEPALAAVDEMIYKEENILFPMAMERLTEQDWGNIWRHSPEYGWCLVEPREGYMPPQAEEEKAASAGKEEQGIVFSTGSLAPEQVRGIFGALPVDVTFVDSDDRVRFFSHGPDSVFSRSKAILGRKVQNCHPPKSVDVVERILSDFRGGKRDVAEFWINLQDKFVHIRYFAVHNEGGEYLGTLEVTQDLTRLRGLEGERRLLEY